ncbi:hypothetical protein ACFYQQ_23875 [Streptomyces sp. NPDC005496]|uniref:hypothetical protein n=1 Tax=Streptomyces sp. NPDC005496 TaxID=3364716 RepID=UPI0036A1D5FC
MITRAPFRQVVHSAAGGDPAGLGLALAVARELHPPLARAPEVAPAAARPVRANRTRRRTAARA